MRARRTPGGPTPSRFHGPVTEAFESTGWSVVLYLALQFPLPIDDVMRVWNGFGYETVRVQSAGFRPIYQKGMTFRFHSLVARIPIGIECRNLTAQREGGATGHHLVVPRR